MAQVSLSAQKAGRGRLPWASLHGIFDDLLPAIRRHHRTASKMQWDLSRCRPAGSGCGRLSTSAAESAATLNKETAFRQVLLPGWNAGYERGIAFLVESSGACRYEQHNSPGTGIFSSKDRRQSRRNSARQSHVPTAADLGTQGSVPAFSSERACQSLEVFLNLSDK